MYDIFFGGTAAWFSIPAFVGTAVFLFRVALMLVGGDADLDAGDSGSDASDHAFEILSIQAIAAFAMGFGWAGLASTKGSDWSLPIGLIVGLFVGGVMVWLLAILMRAMHSLRSSGNIPISRALGCEGSVYVTVPGDGKGRGQVRLVVSGRQRMYRAITEGEEIVRNSRVRVTRVNNDNTVTVVQA